VIEPMSPHSDQHFDTIQRALCEWLVANDIDPHDVPRGAVLSIVDGRLTYERWHRSELTGSVQADPQDSSRLLTETVTVSLAVEPPSDVAKCLRPKCPTCGR
jgi:hypothetical protein